MSKHIYFLKPKSLDHHYYLSFLHHPGAEASLLFQVGTEAPSLFQPGAEYSSARFPVPSWGKKTLKK